MRCNKQSIVITVLLLTLCLPSLNGTFAQTARTAPQVNRPASKLPPALRARGQSILNEQDEKKRAGLADDLAGDEPIAALPFLLTLLESDKSAEVRRAIINELSEDSAIQTQPRFWQTLERLAATDADTKTALLALDKLRAQRLNLLRKLLAQRLALARRNNDEAAQRQLLDEDERWISLVNGTMLPSFLRTSPPPFAVKEAGQPVRVLVLGDFGYGDPKNRQLPGKGQKDVAAALQRAQQQTSHDFGITLGDNFYPDGMLSLTDPRWQTLWHELYDPLGVKFYATLGNHDWHAADAPAAELLYARQNNNWQMPAPYYTFTAGHAQFFALDTNDFSEAQALWLKEALAQSRARWKIAFGHHPIYSHGRHGDTKRLIERLLPVLKDKADAYFAGHEHDLQHLKPEGGVHLFINGGGGAGIRKIEAGPRSLFALSAYGFVSLEIDAKKLDVKFIGTEGQTLYQYALAKADDVAPASNQK